MAIYGNVLEGFFNKSKSRKELEKIQPIINKYISSLNSKFFLSAKLNRKSFSQFLYGKADNFYLEFVSNIAEPKVMKQMFIEFAETFDSKISELEKEVQKSFPDFKISFVIKKSNLTLQINCKEK